MLSTSIVPPCARAIAIAIDRPSPVPRTLEDHLETGCGLRPADALSRSTEVVGASFSNWVSLLLEATLHSAEYPNASSRRRLGQRVATGSQSWALGKDCRPSHSMAQLLVSSPRKSGARRTPDGVLPGESAPKCELEKRLAVTATSRLGNLLWGLTAG